MAYDFPTEVVTIVLSNLGRTDLLGCRLVNHSWNRESLHVFRKSSFRMHLNICQTGGSANKYIEFASTKNPQLVLPIHLSFKRFHLPHPKTLEIVSSLQTLLGPDSIHGFTLYIHCHVEEDDRTVMNLLSKISHALKTLEVKYFVVLRTEACLLDLMKDLEFPNVTSLKYLIGTKNRLMPVQAQFILKCPNLKQLCLESESPDVTLPSTLQKFGVRTLTEPRKFRNNIMAYSDLHTLKIKWYKSEDRQIIHEILESIVKTLKSLTIGVDTMSHFPRFPYLKFLRLHSMTDQTAVVGLNPDDLNLNSETFPSLKLFRLPFIFSISRGSPLPSVKTLTLSVSANCRNPYVNPYSKTSSLMQDYFKNLKIIFPNATTMCLKQTIPDQFQCKTVLKELICSDLAQQIEKIQIKGANRDILGETLEQSLIPAQIMMIHSGNRDYDTEGIIQRAFELWTGKVGIEGIEYKDVAGGPGRRIVFSEGIHTQHKMTNVKRVEIVFRDGEGLDGDVSDFKLNLMSIAKNLPGLTEIEIFGIRNELYFKEIYDVKIQYPNLILKITKLGSKN